MLRAQVNTLIPKLTIAYLHCRRLLWYYNNIIHRSLIIIENVFQQNYENCYLKEYKTKKKSFLI